MIDLSRFCDEGDYPKYEMGQPFNVGGWTYATNSIVLVRIPTTAGDTVSDRKLPPVKEVFAARPEGADLVPWPERRYCLGCLDKRTAGLRTCMVCDGRLPSGQILNVCGVPAIPVGDHLIDVKYDHLIRTLPNVKYLGGVKCPDDYSKVKPLPFFFDGGEGMVMGMRKEFLRD